VVSNIRGAKTMICPACGGTLVPVTAEGLTVDVCRGGCGGIWFDQRELAKVDEQHESAGEILLSIEKDPGTAIDRRKKRTCPRCSDVVMMRHFFSVKQQVEVDECPGCGGFWLDPGELAAIRSEYATDADRQRAAEEYFSAVFDRELAAMREEGNEKVAKARSIARIFRTICPSYYLRGKQDWGAY
jgi:Zn-finger nucleic acid-binding protein